MFNKEKFSEILTKIINNYESISDFSIRANVGRSYISKYINQKIDNPPTPKILMKIANNSNKITNYEELMIVCGYLRKDMEFSEISKNIFYKYSPLLKELDIDNELMDMVYKTSMDPSEENEKEFKNLISKLPEEKGDKIYNISTKILSEINEMMSSTINNISIRAKYNIEDNLLDNQFYLCPVYGKISAGQPNWAEECLDGYLPIDPNLMNIVNPEECFFLKINGESMNKVIKNGAYALIRKTDFVENGEIAVVLVNGFDATLKKFTKQGDVIVLEPMSDDPTITTQVYNKDTSIKVIGKYIGKMEMNN